MREEWKCVCKMSGEQYVMTHGASVMLMLPASSLDSLIQVSKNLAFTSTQTKIIIGLIIHPLC